MSAAATGRTAGTSVVDGIKELILAGGLRPGDPLPTENELSERLGVSRSRVREAVKTLVALDIVEVRHGFGTYVGAMGLDALVQALAFRSLLQPPEGEQHVLADLIDVRQLLETSLAPVIVRRLTADSLAAMRTITARMSEKASRGVEFQDEDREFHLLLMQTTGNSLAVQLTGAFWDVHALAHDVLGPPSDLAETAEAHVAILDAIAAHDADRVAAAIVAHYVPVRARMDRVGSGRTPRA